VQNAYWIERLGEKRAELAGQQREWDEREAQARSLEDLSRKNLGRVQDHKSAREQKLKRLQTDRAAHEQALRELNAASQRLTALLVQLKRQAADLERRLRFSGAPFGQRLGRLLWPTRGRVIAPFGKVRHPRFNTYLLHKGIDIAGPIGQNVFAVAPGNVLFAEWFEGYGRMIIVDHGGGFNTVYAHLAKISASAGQRVEEGQVIATLGDSGTWNGPALYFEIRHKGEAVDPLPWLKP
jgi:murein DD-endopeptidase MepM/ murein hydrolase activator NlpD